MVASVGRIRSELGEFGAAAGASEEEIDRIKLAVSEAVTNVVVHAYGDATGAVHVSASTVDGKVLVLVTDDGHGLRVDSGRHGLGLGVRIMAQVSDQFTFSTRPSGGLEVSLAFNLAGDGDG